MPRPSPAHPLAPALALLLLASPAAADYTLASLFEAPFGAGCAGAPPQTVANYLGCMSATDGSPVSYRIACVNATAFRADYFAGSGCKGGVVHSGDAAWPAGCVPGSGGGGGGAQSTVTVCKSGSYVAPADGINTYVVGPPDECPLQNTEVYAVSSISKSCHAIAGGGGGADGGAGGGAGSVQYGCNKANVTGTAYASRDCSGPALETSPVMPLGCSASTAKGGLPTYTTCSNKPPAATVARPAASAAATSGGVGDGDAVHAAVLAGAARAAEIAAAAACGAAARVVARRGA